MSLPSFPTNPPPNHRHEIHPHAVIAAVSSVASRLRSSWVVFMPSRTNVAASGSVSAVMFQVLGSIGGIMQAFVVVGVWHSNRDTVNSAHQEVENLTVTYRNLILLPESPARAQVIDRYKQYVVSLVADELPDHGFGKGPNTTTQTTVCQFLESLG